LGDQRLEPRLADQEVQVRGTEIMPALGAQQLANWTVDRNRIAGRLDAAEVEMALGIGRELAAQIHLGLSRILVLVQTLGRGVPYIHFGSGNRPSLLVANPRLDETGRARR